MSCRIPRLSIFGLLTVPASAIFCSSFRGRPSSPCWPFRSRPFFLVIPGRPEGANPESV